MCLLIHYQVSWPLRRWPLILDAGKTEAGREALTSAFKTCAPVRTEGDAQAIKGWLEGPWGTVYALGCGPLLDLWRTFTQSFFSPVLQVAMGNYPYSSSYLMHGKSMLPPWPMRKACAPLSADFGTNTTLLFEGLRQVAIPLPLLIAGHAVSRTLVQSSL